MKLKQAVALVLVASVAFVFGQDAKDKEPDRKVVDSKIEQGLKAWRAGQDRRAYDLLNKAVGLIQPFIERGLAFFLPRKAPEGWTFDEPQMSSGTWGSGGQRFDWTNATLRMRHKDGTEASIEITNSPQVHQATKSMLQMLNNPQYRQMMNQQPGKKIDIAEKGRFTAMTTVEESSANALLAGKSIVVTGRVNRGDGALLDTILSWVDLDGLEAEDQGAAK